MFKLNESHLSLISAGCGSDACQEATLNFLQSCTMEQMKEVNRIFKNILLSDEMKNVDNETKIAALIAAIEANPIV